MKKILLTIALIFSCAMVTNAPSRYVEAVKESDAMMRMIAAGNEILSIKQTDTIINCQGCFEFHVVYRTESGAMTQVAKFFTKDSAFVGPEILVFRRDKVERGPHS